MNTSLYRFSWMIALTLGMLACKKEDDPVAVVTGDVCGHDGARISASVGGADWCANAQVFATASSDGQLIATGISLTGSTFVLDIDSLTTGEQAVTEASNSLLFSDQGSTYTVATDDPGTLSITFLDVANRRAKGTCSVRLHLNGEGPAKQVSGAFDLTWSDQ